MKSDLMLVVKNIYKDIRYHKLYWWFILGAVCLLVTTIAYFGSDDWSGMARRVGQLIALISYGLGLFVGAGIILTLSGKRIIMGIGVLVSLSWLVAICYRSISNRAAYLLTHPISFIQNMIGEPKWCSRQIY
jgi:hypothetical protein